MSSAFWRGKRILLTGHTGFKGSWMSLWLRSMGAMVAGYALPPRHGESLFEFASVSQDLQESTYGDIRDLQRLSDLTASFRPEIVFHLAAQPLVRLSYTEPVETYHVNVMGAVNILEAVRRSNSCRVAVIITSDKCYENCEWVWGYRESDPLGGYDPYSSSKACVELVTAAYRHSFFGSSGESPVGIASARAGNVIGGGDFAVDRLVPDAMTATLRGELLRVRSPNAVRPWQHVLEPLCGYLLLAEKLWHNPAKYSQGWNFGPSQDDTRSVRWVLENLNDLWDHRIKWDVDVRSTPHEAHLLTLDSAKARALLGWAPRWSLDRALEAVVEWWQAYESHKPLRDVMLRQIELYESISEPVSNSRKMDKEESRQ